MKHRTRVQYLAAIAPDMVTKLEEGSYVVEVSGNQKVNAVMAQIRGLTADWTVANRGCVELQEWENLPKEKSE